MGITVKIDDIQPAFNNAHRVMWAKHSGGKILPARSKLPNQWWELEYDVKIIEGEKINPISLVSYRDVWVAAEFASEEALTMFMLRWS